MIFILNFLQFNNLLLMLMNPPLNVAPSTGFSLESNYLIEAVGFNGK